jgi:DNA-binding NtrC family response regulator
VDSGEQGTVTVGGRRVLGSFRVEVIRGPDAGVALELGTERTLVGTHRSSDLRLSDPTVSRLHCELTLAEAGLELRDLGSRNGTRLAGVAIAAATIDRVTDLDLGDTRIRIAPVGSEVEVPLAAGDRFGPLTGASAAMRAVFARLETAAASGATVLLEGETGVGKDLAAAAIHGASRRAGGPLVVVDCGAVARELLESELFGHVRGAFTGANTDRVGAFEAAAGGTLLLDEIGELDLDLQPKLLRALESRSVKRVGSNRPIELDVRVIAATNRDLAAEVNARRFRSDLYYRLAVLVVKIPPLRDRPGDIPMLIEELLIRGGHGDEPGAAALRAPDTLARLSRHAWPGNVRELRNFIERHLAFGGDLVPDDTGAELPAIDPSTPYRIARKRWLARFERAYLEALLEAHGGNVTVAAKAAGIDRVYLHRLLARAGLR